MYTLSVVHSSLGKMNKLLPAAHEAGAKEPVDWMADQVHDTWLEGMIGNLQTENLMFS